MASEWWNDDEALLAALGDALRTADAVPREFVEAGKAAYAWRDIDAELAALTYDSASDEGRVPAVTREEPAALRALTFASPELTIELEVTHDALLGQVVPPQQGDIEVRRVSGPVVTVPIDEIGCFVIRPVPMGAFRLHCDTVGGASALTGWITL